MSQTTPDTRKRDIDIHSDDVVIIGESIYEKDVRPHMTDADKGKMVVIDVYSGDYEIDRNSMVARDRLIKRQPGAIVYIGRVGYRAAHSMPGMRYAADPRQPNP